MLLADTCRELYPAEERLCFMENTGFLFSGTQPVLLGWEHPWAVCRVGTGSFLHITSCSKVGTSPGPGTRNVLLEGLWVKNVNS